MSVSKPIAYPEPEGCLNKYQFENLDDGAVFYGVWKRNGELQKFRLGEDRSSDDPATWCEKGNERRAFTNYFHAYAYSLKVKERRRQGMPIR